MHCNYECLPLTDLNLRLLMSTSHSVYTLHAHTPHPSHRETLRSAVSVLPHTAMKRYWHRPPARRGPHSRGTTALSTQWAGTMEAHLVTATLFAPVFIFASRTPRQSTPDGRLLGRFSSFWIDLPPPLDHGITQCKVSRPNSIHPLTMDGDQTFVVALQTK